MIGNIFSHYKIIEKIGSGGMGDVYKAVDLNLKRQVALKFLPPEFTRDEDARKRFMHEARTASALDHPNIATIFEINESDNHSFITMAYYEGKTLKEKIEEGALEINEAIDIIGQILNGLTSAHSKGIVHRDIKPANIILTDKGVVKIVDFGIAKLKGQTMLTRQDMTMGTVDYMSPEQVRGGGVDHRTDIWSIGAILYEMLAGEKPFKGEYEQPIMYLILNEEPEFISKIRKEVPIELEKIINKALAKDPDKRYQTIEEIISELEIVQEEIAGGKSAISSLFKLGRKQKKTLYRILPFIIIAIVILIYLWQDKIINSGSPSLVLLPLNSISRDTDQEWFTAGMTNALINDLAKISSMRIISLASTMKYKGTTKAPPEIAAELGVDYVIECSIVRIGDQVKILARLIDAPRNEYLWAEEYVREFSDILGLQGELAKTIAGQIEVELTPQEETLLASTRSVRPETYELYLKGMYQINKYTQDGITKGLSYLHQAVETDTTNPLAYAALAIGYCIIAHTPAPPPFALTRAKEMAEKALAIDEKLAEVHLALGMISIYQEWDKSGAEKSYKRALELNPSLTQAHNHYSWLLLLKGEEESAISELYLAQDLDPLTAAFPAWQAMLYFWLGRNDQAIIESLKSLELLADFPIALYTLGSAYAAKGMFKEALAVHQKLGEISLDWKWSLGQTYALQGKSDEARAVAAELESQPKVWYTWGLAEIYTALKEKEKAFYWLEEAYKQRHPYIQWIRRNPCLNYLRDDPRFDDLSRRLKLTE